LDEKKRALDEKKRALDEKKQALIKLARLMKSAGASADEIRHEIGLEPETYA
jgi:hypothetical protein